MDNEWKDKLRERFSDYSVPEPEGLWEGIEQGMAGKPRRKWLPVWLVSGAAAAAAVALVLFLRPVSEGPAPVPDARPETLAVADTVVPPAIPVEEAWEAVPEPSAPFAVLSRRTLLAEAQPVTVEPESKTSEPESKTVEPKVIPEDSETPEEPEVTVPDHPVEPVGTEPQENTAAATEDTHFSIGVYREGGQAVSAQSQGFGITYTGDYLTRSTGGQTGSDGLIRMLSSNKASSLETRHQAPLRVGVKMAWPLTRHLSLVSGLNWTSLSSEFEETTADTKTLVEQNLGYLGLPLRLEAGFQPLKGLRLYAGAGGMLEKGLMATSKAYSYIGDHQESVIRSSPDMGGLLWSVGAEAGAEYRLTPSVGIYAAPGVEYHFDNGSGIRSAYTEKPLHWNLSLGLRFNFAK